MSTHEHSVREPHTQALTPDAARRNDLHWGVLVTLGVLMLLVGIAAIAFPLAATLAAEIVIGAALLISGVLLFAQAVSRSGCNGRGLTCATGLLSIVAGLLLLAFPVSGVVTLTLLVGAYFLISGGLRVALALVVRPLDSWGWMMLSGVLALVLALLVIVQFPDIAAWLLGVLVGVDLLFAGWWALLIGLTQRRQSG